MSTFVNITLRCRRTDSLCALVRWFCVSRKDGTGGGGWGHLQGDLHTVAVVAVVAACRNALVATGWSIAQISSENTALTL